MGAANTSSKYTHFSNVSIGTSGGSGALQINGTDVTATATEINAVANGSGSYVVVTDAASYTVLAADSGKTLLVPDLSQDSTLALPTAAAGLRYRLVYAGNAADAHDWVVDTGADANFYIGGITQHDPDAAGDDTAVTHPDGNSNSKMGILTPDSGTVIELICDGTNWYVFGTLISTTDTGVTFADQ